MYVSPNYRTKKQLIEAVKEGKRVSVFSPGPFPCPKDGYCCVEGPHYPEPHKWYTAVILKGGIVVSVKK